MVNLIKSPSSNYHSPTTKIVLITPAALEDEVWNSEDDRGERTDEIMKLYADACVDVANEANVPVVNIWQLIHDKLGKKKVVSNSNNSGGDDGEIFTLKDFLYDGLHFAGHGCDTLFDGLMKVIRENYPELDPDNIPLILPAWDEMDPNKSLAALSVVYSHSQNLFKQTLPYYTYNMIGFDGVRCFFVLSAFLLTFRGMLEWEAYLEKRNIPKEEDAVKKQFGNLEYQNVRNNDNEENEESTGSNSSIPLLDDDDESGNNKEYHETIIGLNSKTTKNLSAREGISSTLYDYLPAVKIWAKFFLRRFLRVYPPYSILLVLIAYNKLIGESYFNIVTPDNLISHLTLTESEFIFWSIPPEMKFYLFIPVIIIGYVGLGHLGKKLIKITNYNEKKGEFIGRFIALSIIVFARTIIALTLGDRNPLWLEGTAHYFLAGSLGAILYREAVRLNLLPKSEEEEKKDDNNDEENAYKIPKKPKNKKDLLVSLVYNYFYQKIPTLHTALRNMFDLSCYIMFIIILCTMPRLSSKVLGYSYNLQLEINAGGLLYAALILLGLLSRNESFVKLLSWNYFCFCGKISFSIYLLHPIAFNLVNNYISNYLTFIGNVETLKDVDQSDEVEKYNDMFDSVMLSFLVTTVLAWFYHKFVELPFMNLANSIARKWLK
ncbi:11826_t:CDS:2 [Entrophospora sp. SA101]|nr:11826_t:CDS:2 [Entrophospora sp. SA101]